MSIAGMPMLLGKGLAARWVPQVLCRFTTTGVPQQDYRPIEIHKRSEMVDDNGTHIIYLTITDLYGSGYWAIDAWGVEDEVLTFVPNKNGSVLEFHSNVLEGIESGGVVLETGYYHKTNLGQNRFVV